MAVTSGLRGQACVSRGCGQRQPGRRPRQRRSRLAGRRQLASRAGRPGPGFGRTACVQGAFRSVTTCVSYPLGLDRGTRPPWALRVRSGQGRGPSGTEAGDGGPSRLPVVHGTVPRALRLQNRTCSDALLSRLLHIYYLTLCAFYLFHLTVTEHLTDKIYQDYR